MAETGCSDAEPFTHVYVIVTQEPGTFHVASFE
jgi:hypothetical protein